MEVLDGGTVVGMHMLNQRVAPDSFVESSQSGNDWLFPSPIDFDVGTILGVFEESVVIDAVHVRPIQGDAGADDNFSCRALPKQSTAAIPMCTSSMNRVQTAAG